MNRISAETARALAEELVAKQPAGFHDRLSDDPSFKRWLITDITLQIADAYFTGREDHAADAARNNP